MFRGSSTGSLRRAVSTTLLVLTSVAVLACDRHVPERHDDTGSPVAPVSSPAVEPNGNPFAHFAGLAYVGYGREPKACIQSAFKLPPQTAGGVIEGTLVLTNHCDTTMAVLTAPVELRLRLRADQRFPFEASGISNVYAVAYLFKQEHGLDSGSFLGDGGLRVSFLPDFATVGPKETLELPLTSGIPVDWGPGEYGVLFATRVVPAPGLSTTPATIDLSKSIAALSASREPTRQLRIPPGAMSIFARGSITLKPAPGSR